MQLNKTKVGTIAALATGFVCGAAGKSQAGYATDRAAINARYSVYAQAFKARDIAALLGMETPDYTHVLITGKTQNRKLADTEFARQVRAAKSIASCNTKIQQISIKNGLATVQAWQSVKATILDAKGGKHGVVSDTTSRDTWVKNSKGWFLRRTQDISSHTLIDGHAVR